ncbi:MAG TPA: prolyl oligopeptidase family serine peptidase [Trebonia sp.]|nr:prolyl oligopeptidase family serine peptidase [Trebonia sp.]
MTESFPRQQARTRGFTLGVPRAFQISPDGQRVIFLRSKAGSDPVNCLWELNLATGEESLVADPRALGADEENLPPEERARRERVRETAAGIVAFSTDHDATLAVFALSGQVFTVPLGVPSATPQLLATQTPALEPRIDPAGKLVAYVHDGALCDVNLATGEDRVVAKEDGVTFGLAEFIAAEEMDRARGYWWAPDGKSILIERVDESPVHRWHIADPANPDKKPNVVAYPAAGTPNAEVSLFIATLPDAEEEAGVKLTEVHWDQARFPYLVTAAWDKDLLIVVQTRDQRTMRLFNGLTGETIREDSDPQWTDIIGGVPAQLDDGSIVWTEIGEDTRRLIVAQPGELAGAVPVTPAGLQVRRILGTDGNDVLFQASTEPTEAGVWRYGPGGLREVATAPGVHTAMTGGGTTILSSRTLESPRLHISLTRDGSAPATVVSHAEQPNLPLPAPRFFDAGPTGIRTAVLFPSWHEPGTRLPVLVDPYGGPAAQRTLKTASIFLASQWFAEQGFAVVVADGRGTPGRSPSWDRTIAGDFATPALDDQVAALQAAAKQFSDLDTGRVAMRGWSHGGYLSALAVLRRPDVFHAGIAGAPVTDWRLYDTHYTERYLGDPASNPAAYTVSSVNDDPERAVLTVVRPLLIIHGLADDNVFVAHSLRLSSALLAAGYPHRVLPLSGVTHMTPQEVVAENLLLLQVAFLREALG